jgi:hypothetical protein
MTLYYSFDEMPIFNFLMIYKTNNYQWLYKEYYTNDNEFNFNQSINKDFLIFGFSRIEYEFNKYSLIYETEPQKTFNYTSGGVLKEGCFISFISTIYSGHIYHLRTKKNDELTMYLNEIKQIGLIIVEHFLNENEFLENSIKSEIDFENTTLFEWCEIRKKTLFL